MFLQLSALDSLQKCRLDDSLVGVQIETEISHVRSSDKRSIVGEVVHHDREALETPPIDLVHARQGILNLETRFISVALRRNGGI